MLQRVDAQSCKGAASGSGPCIADADTEIEIEKERNRKCEKCIEMPEAECS